MIEDQSQEETPEAKQLPVEKTEAELAKEQMKAIHDDGFAEINGRKYTFTVMTHEQRRRVFAYYSSIGPQVQAQNFSFLSTPEFQGIEKILLDRMTLDGMQISKIDGHFEKHPSDYVTFICCALGVISYPFFPESPTS